MTDLHRVRSNGFIDQLKQSVFIVFKNRAVYVTNICSLYKLLHFRIQCILCKESVHIRYFRIFRHQISHFFRSSQLALQRFDFSTCFVVVFFARTDIDSDIFDYFSFFLLEQLLTLIVQLFDITLAYLYSWIRNRSIRLHCINDIRAYSRAIESIFCIQFVSRNSLTQQSCILLFQTLTFDILFPEHPELTPLQQLCLLVSGIVGNIIVIDSL